METQPLPTGSIVVGVDAAQLTDRAVDWAADQAALEQRHLLLVHGTGSPLTVSSQCGRVGGPDPLELYVDMQAAGRALLSRATTRAVTRHPGLVVHQVVRPVDPRRALLDVSSDAALIVVGSRGRGHVLSVVLGSVSEEVAERASCPVVVIRPQHGVHPRRGVLVGTDGTAESVPVLRFAYRQARLRGLPLTVMHTMGGVESSAPRSVVIPAEASALGPAHAMLAASVADLAGRYPEVPTTLEVGRGAPADCLLSRADTMDLVVVGHHVRGIFGRFTHESVAVCVLERASVAIAVVPVSAEAAWPARSHAEGRDATLVLEL